ncbi:MAG: hypothetical protein ACT4QF_07110 [Sporichthyaceae bacterium]
MVGRRGVAGLILVSLLGTVSACGSEGETALPGPQETVVATPVSTAVIPPTTYSEAFAAISSAAEAMPATADRLARGLATAGGVRGQANSAAATLRAKLTHRLTLHVHLAGMLATSVVDTGSGGGPDSDRTKAVLAAIDRNSKALAKLVPKGPKAGGAERAPSDPGTEVDDDAARRSPDFLVAWRTHVDDLAAYALATREGIEPDQDDARRNLESWVDGAADNLKQAADGKAQSRTLRGSLNGYVKAITRAMNGLGAKDFTGPEQLRKASSAMLDFGEGLGQGLAAAADLDGDARDDAADVRAELTRLLTENVAMTGSFVLASYVNRKSGASSSTQASIARLGLDENSKDLAERLRPAADASAQVEFLRLWRTTVNDFLDYAEAVRTGSAKKADAEVAALNGQRATIGRFLEGVTDRKVSAGAISTSLKTYVANLTGAVQTLAEDLLPDRS